MRRMFLLCAAVVIALTMVAAIYSPPLALTSILTGPLLYMGFYDFFQTKHAIRRNYPLLGRIRYLLEEIRPEMHQYFVESESDGVPFSREERSLVYQRAKDVIDTMPFGTKQDTYAVGYEWVNHSLAPTVLNDDDLRVTVGGSDCKQPYSSSIFNISAMSFGSLSSHAILALNGGAKDGNFSHNTGEGSISPFHLEPGGDIVWQVGTGYFGCRTKDGNFNPDSFQERSHLPTVKMIEIKLSQGAKPGHGGILPARKITPMISKIRDIPMGQDCLSPPAHSAFSTPTGLVEFVGKLRELSGGKPVGFKLCVGRRREFLAVCKAMLETQIYPDFITVDGGEGGTGAAPVEFSNHIGSPLVEALIFVQNALVGFGIRDKIRIIASGRITTAFGIIRKMAFGADITNSARAMMMAVGCIQALKCNTNACPTGVTTQDPSLVAGLVVKDKRTRVASYHKDTVEAVREILGSMGLSKPSDLRPWHVMRRIGSTEVRHYGEIHDFLKDGALLESDLPAGWDRAMAAATTSSFRHSATV